MMTTPRSSVGSGGGGGGSGSSGSNTAIVLNVEQFIQDVECRPAIWNRNYHCNKQFLELTWIELSKLYKLPCQTLKAKWKGLRDNFRVEYKRIPRDENGEMLINPEFHESKWAHYRPLLFLVEHMRHRTVKENSSNLTNILIDNDNYNNCGENEECVVEPDLAHGLVHNDYTSDGQNDDDEDCMNQVTINNNTNQQNLNCRTSKRNQNSRKRKKQNNDSICMDIKTEPTDQLNDPTRKTTFNNTINNQQQQQQQQQQISKLKLRKMQTNNNNNNNNLNNNLNNNNNNLIDDHLNDNNNHHKNNNLNLNLNDDLSIESINCFNPNNCISIDKPPIIMAATSSSTLRKNSFGSDRDDDDYHYLMSLHPYMNKLQPSQKLRVRTKIQKLILKELYKEDLD